MQEREFDTALIFTRKRGAKPVNGVGRRPGHVPSAPWRGFSERPWSDALFLSAGRLAWAATQFDRIANKRARCRRCSVRRSGVDVLRLSPQQARIVGLILQGKRDKQIAAALGLQVPAVRTHLRAIFARNELADRMELALRIFATLRGRDGHKRTSSKLISLT